MEAVLKRGDDAEVPATPSHPPEEVRVLRRAGHAELTVRSDNIDRQEVVAGQAETAHEHTKAAAESESCNACGGDGPPCGCQAEGLGLLIELSPGEARLSTGSAPGRINPYPLHQSQVDHEATIAHGIAGHAVAATTDGHQQVVGPRDIDGADHIRGPGAAGDEGRLAVDHAVPDLSDGFVLVIAWAQKRTA